MTLVRALLGPYVHTVPLLDGEVRPEGVELEVSNLPGDSAAWNAWPRGAGQAGSTYPYDLSEMSIIVALGAKEYGLPFTPIPVFLTRRLDVQRVVYNVDAGIAGPKDLEGKRVATGAYHTDVDLHNAGVLTEMCGVDPEAVQWVATRQRHIAAAELPPNVELRLGADVNEMLETGEVAAATSGYTGTSSRVRPLLDRSNLSREWVAERGFFPIFHTIVVSNALLADHPGIGQAIYEAFLAAKKPFLTSLARGEDVWDAMEASGADAAHTFGVSDQAGLVRPDPIPYGIERNRPVLEFLLRTARQRGFLHRSWELEELFAVPGGADD